MVESHTLGRRFAHPYDSAAITRFLKKSLFSWVGDPFLHCTARPPLWPCALVMIGDLLSSAAMSDARSRLSRQVAKSEEDRESQMCIAPPPSHHQRAPTVGPCLSHVALESARARPDGLRHHPLPWSAERGSFPSPSARSAQPLWAGRPCTVEAEIAVEGACTCAMQKAGGVVDGASRLAFRKVLARWMGRQHGRSLGQVRNAREFRSTIVGRNASPLRVELEYLGTVLLVWPFHIGAFFRWCSRRRFPAPPQCGRRARQPGCPGAR